MGSVFSYCLLAIAAVLLAVYLRQGRPEHALLLVLSAGILIFFAALRWMQPIFDALAGLAESADLSEYMILLLRALGICCITKFAADFCKDAGHAAVAGKIELLGRCSVLLMSLPLIQNVVEMLSGLVEK